MPSALGVVAGQSIGSCHAGVAARALTAVTSPTGSGGEDLSEHISDALNHLTTTKKRLQ